MKDLPLVPSGLAARLPGKWVPATGLAARDPWGVPLREVADGGISLSSPEPPSGRVPNAFLTGLDID